MAAQTRHVVESSKSTCGYLMAVNGATRSPPPRSDDSTAAGSRLLIRQVKTPAYIAAGHHIWRLSPYPPPGVAVGSLQLGPITHTHTLGDLLSPK